jgi:uncharacterized protein (TIGR03435 family)
MKTLHVVCVSAALALGHTSTFAQEATPARFEVASVKPSGPNSLFGRRLRLDTVDEAAGCRRHRRLEHAATPAGPHGLKRPAGFSIVGGPSWQMSSKFDITAKAAEGTTTATQDLLPMMKTLLADRFKLKTHTETRDLPIYALIVARSDGKLGPDIKPSSSDCSNAAEAQKRAEEVAKGGGAGLLSMLAKGETIPCMIMPAINPSNPSGGFGMRGNGQAMIGLTKFLTQVTGRMVHDKTGLTGLYDFELRFDPQVLMAMLPQLGLNIPSAATANLPASDSPALLTALQEQLGLKLDSQKGPVEVLVDRQRRDCRNPTNAANRRLRSQRIHTGAIGETELLNLSPLLRCLRVDPLPSVSPFPSASHLTSLGAEANICALGEKIRLTKAGAAVKRPRHVI